MSAQRQARPRLVGRREQFALFDAAVGAAQTGEAQFVVLGGEAGVGKTQLMEHFAGWLDESGWRVLRGVCVQLGTEGLPLVAVTAVLRDLVGQLGADRVAGMLPSAEVVLRLLPELGVRGDAPESQRDLFEVFAALLRRVSAEHEVLVVIDDLHLADRSTRDLLGFLARTLRAARVVVACAYRSDDLGRGHPLRTFLAEIGRLSGVHRAELGRFSRAEVAELVTGVLGMSPPADLIDSVYRRSAGNAFFAEELARAGRSEGGSPLPSSLHDLLMDRVGRLAEPARELIRVAAVGDLSVPHGLLAKTAGFDEGTLLTGLHAAVDAQVLATDPDRGTYRFRHALLREAVLDDMFAAERVHLHRVYAEALEADPELVTPDRYAAELAFHWYSANEPGKALPALLQAAAAAEALYAHAEQSQMLLRALDVWSRVPGGVAAPMPDRFDLWEKVITAAELAGEPLDALGHVNKALAETDKATDPEGAAMLHALRSLAAYHLGLDGLEADIEEALRLLTSAPTPRRATVLEILGHLLMMRRQPQRARAVSKEAMDIAATVGDKDVETSARAVVGVALAQQGAFDEALAVLAEVRDRAADCGDAVRLARMHNNLAHVLASIGRFPDAIDAARAGLDLAGKAGVSRTVGAILTVNLAYTLVMTGRWQEADAACARALAHDPMALVGAQLHAIRGHIALTRGDIDAAREQQRLASVLLGRTTGTVLATLPAARLVAEIALRENRLGDAQHAIARALPAVEECNDLAVSWRLLTTGARVVAHARSRARTLGIEPVAESLAGELCSAAAALPTDTPVTAAYAAQFAAEIDRPCASWPAAISAWDEIGEPYAASYARFRAAETVTKSDDKAAPASWLRTAADYAIRLEAKPLLHEIELAARSAGIALATEPQRPAAASDVQRLGLTSREAEVLRLLAAGRSNRQIAEQLVISPKTASAHVSRILTKLGATSRGEAAATAHRLHLFDQNRTG